MIDLDELRKLANAATPGPWQANSDDIWGDRDSDGWTVVAMCPCPKSPHGSARRLDWGRDASFISAANPSTILALLDEIDRCHARLEIDHVWHSTSGGVIPVRVPYSDRAGMPDGVECRDETIKIQDESISKLESRIVADLASYEAAMILSADLQEKAVAAARDAALEEAAKLAARDADWTLFGKRDFEHEQWDGGRDAVRDYRVGIQTGQTIAAAIRAIKGGHGMTDRERAVELADMIETGFEHMATVTLGFSAGADVVRILRAFAAPPCATDDVIADIEMMILYASGVEHKPAWVGDLAREIIGRYRHFPAIPIGTKIEKVGGSYGGPGIVRGYAEAEIGSPRYLVGHQIEGGYGEFLHVYPIDMIRVKDGTASTCPSAVTDEMVDRALAAACLAARREASRLIGVLSGPLDAAFVEISGAAEELTSIAIRAALEAALSVEEDRE